MIQEIKKRLKNMKKLTMSMESDYERGCYDGRQAAYESVLELAQQQIVQQPKYKSGDTVFWLKRPSLSEVNIHEGVITWISIKVRENSQQYNEYGILDINEICAAMQHDSRGEQNLYATRKDAEKARMEIFNRGKS